jgi:demethylmenaquinone methyltransferase/2-methoxy-6-polyprenyl-1,4-benzoquinol methylase
MLAEPENRLARDLFEGLPDRYDLLAQVLSLGQDARWRSAAVDAIVAARPGSVLDVATGPAGVALEIRARTGADVTGIDLTEPMLRRGLLNIRNQGQGEHIHLVLGRGEQLPFADRTFDALTFTYLLRYVADPAATVRELARVVKSGGVVASLEFHVPPNPIWRGLWLAYTRVVLPAAGLVTGGKEWFKVGRFLGPSISGYYRRYPTGWHVDAWQSAGLAEVRVRLMSLGGGLVMWGRKGGESTRESSQ